MLNAKKKCAALMCATSLFMCAATGAGASDAVDAALENPNRPSHDLRLDPVRKPGEVLEFFKIQPGMKVIDLFSGPGYYSEILNHLVGQEGAVIMYNHAPWEAYSKKASDARVAGGRLENAKTQYEDLNTVDFGKGQYDAALAVLGMHDLYLKSEKSTSGQPIDVEHFLQALYRGIKPGGIVGIVEHEAKKGIAPAESAELHRLDSEHIKKIMLDAGFVFEAQSSVLRNNADDLTQIVWADGLRRHTDRAVMRFRKPTGR
ncbi:MAG: class I SAM-dependent methyltransferase [Alphaproteobacteria bacterium]|nr:class I SAM-dependent methyltransferase [Alphaproteobacteria bacterium]